jgi:aminomethyltransferase
VSQGSTQTGRSAALKRTPLHDLHRALGARMVPFAGYEMPVQYGAGILAEHAHTRERASLFDVSHMGQAWFDAKADVAGALERLVAGDIRALAPGRMRYTLLLDDDGGIVDDLMVVRPGEGERLLLVVNAAGKEIDYAFISQRLEGRAGVEPAERLALLALQGPLAATVIERFCPAAAGLAFMGAARLAVEGVSCTVSRSGYTGEDGFELSVPANRARELAERLLEQPEVMPAGLGARDSLRLEAGLCLYGHDIDRTTSPVEAGLAWTIGTRRRAAADFPGAERILRELADGPARLRVGLRPQGRVPARAGTGVVDSLGMTIGKVTSGGFAPSVGAPVAMGYVRREHAAPGTAVKLAVRERLVAATVARLPFVPHRYHRP